MTDAELLRAVLDHDTYDAGAGGLHDDERAAFEDMLDRGRPLSDKQRAWVRAAAGRIGLVLPAENLFSSMPDDVRAEHERRASCVQLPWERPGYQKPAKPPGR